MKLALANGNVYIQNTKAEYPIVKGLPNAKFDKKIKAWVVPATLDILDRLQRFVKLTPKLEAERQRLQRKQALIDKERMDEEPVPLVDYPVKVKLFRHQIRGANMALYALEMEDRNVKS